MKILRYSALGAMSSILWTLGLTLCGALRTILLWEHSEIALLAAVTAITTLSHDKVSTYMYKFNVHVVDLYYLLSLSHSLLSLSFLTMSPTS